jgi:cytochrome b561
MMLASLPFLIKGVPVGVTTHEALALHVETGFVTTLLIVYIRRLVIEMSFQPLITVSSKRWKESLA